MIHHGDCLEVMAAMEPESVDAIVTDPPYGLEFMGKEWDRLGDVGKTSHSGPAERDNSSPYGRTRVAFSGSSNVKCRKCGKWQWDHVGRKCECERPDFPSVTRHQGVLMGAWHQRWAEAAYRVAKPSAYLLAFGGTRTVHRMTVALEDAGWIIRDMLVWAYASGFPKSKASLKPAWEPIVMARKPGPLRMLAIDESRIGVEGGGTDCSYFPEPCQGHGDERSQSGPTIHTIRPTATIGTWENGASLCVSCAVDAGNSARLGAPATRASIIPRLAELSLSEAGSFGDTSRAGTGCSHGMTPVNGGSSLSTDESGKMPTGLFHPDTLSTISTKTNSITGSRTCTCCGGPITPTTTSATPFDTETGLPAPTTSESIGSVGRWPSNLVLTDPIFDGGVEGVVGGGEVKPGFAGPGSNGWAGWHGDGSDNIGGGYGDSGTYSRFFLVPKSSRSDREPAIPPEWFEDGKRANSHPTCKPTELMRHLVRLVTPPGGTVLDPFLGSGTTGLACELEGFPWIGIEKEAEYVAIAEARLNGTQRGLGLAG